MWKLLVPVSLVVCAQAAPYQELVPKFDRIKSNCMVRQVEFPTMANLDYSAYDRNPVLFDIQKAKPKKPSEPITLATMTFNGSLSDVKDQISGTPLTESEKGQPLAWRALSKRLWEVVKEQKFQNYVSTINGYKWGDPSVALPYQEIATAYIHKGESGSEIWVKIEFAPWVNFITTVVDDEDKDGVREIYGKLSTQDIAADSLSKALKYIEGDYTKRRLTREEMVDWITDLASYWYPTKNTDIIDMTGQEFWPNEQTKKVAFKTLKGLRVKNPLAVVEGKPFSPKKPIYNVYVVNEPVTSDAAPDQTTTVAANASQKVLDTLISKNFKDNNARFEKEIKTYGSYENWAKKNSSFLESLKKYMASLPAEQMGFKGKADWVFFRKSVDYVVGGDLNIQSKEKNPIPHLVEFQNYLKSQGVSMIFVPIPNKEEVYFEQLPTEVKAPQIPLVNPYSRKFLKDAQAAGIEVIDLLPLFLKAKEQDKNSKENVYQRQDTHWSNRGLQIAAEAIAARVKEFAWYNDVTKMAFTSVDTTFSRQGDIVDRLPEADRPNYPPVVLEAKQVRMPEGTPYKPNKAFPILLIGDSFTGVFESVDCKSAGVGAHIASKTGIPVDIITSWGGGPLVREKSMNARAKDLPVKRLVIYMMVARDLYNYKDSWTPFVPK